MLKTQITREELDRLGEEIRRHFELHTVERGLEFQQKGYVYNTEVLPGRAIVSKVQGGEVYDVKLDLDFFGLSECSCPYEGCCEHMAAVFFYAFSVYARPDAFVKDWKMRQEEPRIAGKSSKLHRQTALLPSAQPASVSLKENATPEEWLAHIQHEFTAFSERHNQWKYDIEEYYSAALQTAIRPSTWWLPGTKKLLTVLGLLYALQKLEQDYDAGGQGASPRLLNYKETVETLERRLEETADEIDAEEAARRWPDHLRSLGTFVSKAITAKPAVPYVRWMDVYRLLWTRLLRQEAWMEQETARVEGMIAGSAYMTESERDDWQKARAHFDVMSGHDKEAWLRLGQAASFHPAEGLFYANEFRRTEQWERLWLWLQWLLPQCRKADRDLFQKLCSYAAEASKPLGREEEWARALVSMLPASYYVYTEFLIKSGRFRDWADYHLAENVAVFELYPSDLRAAEAHDPTLVFPLYHQSIERCILQKNRTAYKEAIRLMKKLAALYAQAGQPDRYELFLRKLSQQYSRLRAFREELTKGKLLR
ncbi:SWIM zinc finger family protein [Paenibacillus hemerocallicola]|uniref:SWIM zinc finger family protein n=1 Tax=Paenibacillus hemerocallicola TaxID=1172614 RepID=A0A5C4T1J5_9BACL|nr:SWIM zinc finger family protein [Paenibacillus hemerocallicola]TNJ62863.1 SWIM zinc finger family protein [Paenibacillus hemerocallicola]